MNTHHIPVMVKEMLSAVSPKADGVYIDATFGGGGYTQAILEIDGTSVVTMDCDKEAYTYYKQLPNEMRERCSFYHKNFSEINNIVSTKVQGIVFDLGVSSMQLDTKERGFSFLKTAPLDMRMNRSQGFSAKEVINNSSKEKLVDIIYNYGGEKKASQIAKAIVHERQRNEIKTTSDLANIILKVTGCGGKTHHATKTFQAIRIYVNDELRNLEIALEKSLKILDKGGVLCVISFHSLEDKIAKSIFNKKIHNGYEKFSKKIVTPQYYEIKINPRARSSKLRAIRRVL